MRGRLFIASTLSTLCAFIGAVDVSTLLVQQYSIRVTVLPQPPFVQCDGTVVNGTCTGRWYGMIVDLLESALTAAEQKNGSVAYSTHYYVVPDGGYGTKTASGAWTGMIGEVTKHRADIAAGPTQITTARLGAVTFSVPWMTSPFALLVRTPASTEDTWAFLKPFSGTLWAAIFAMTFFFALSFIAAERFSPFGMRYDATLSATEKRTWNSAEAFATAFSTLLGSGGGKGFAWSTRLLLMSMYLVSLIIMSQYTAQLTAFAAVKRFQEPIATLQDVIRNRTPMAVVSSASVYSWIQTNADPEIRSITSFWVPVTSYVAAVDLLKAGAVDVVIGTKPSLLYYAVNPPCGLQLVGEMTSFGYYALIFQQNSTIFDPINLALQSVVENGYIGTLQSTYYADNCAQSTTLDANVMGIQEFEGVFYTVFIFSGLAAISLWVERLAYKNRFRTGRCKFWRRLNICCGHHYDPERVVEPPQLDIQKVAEGTMQAVRRMSQQSVRRLSMRRFSHATLLSTQSSVKSWHDGGAPAKDSPHSPVRMTELPRMLRFPMSPPTSAPPLLAHES